MKKFICLGVVGLSLVFTGCWQKSVFPFYRDKDLTFDKGLEGHWTEMGKPASEASTWKFERDGEKAYKLVIHTENADYPFDAHLFRLGTNQFLDLYSQKRSMSEIPAHHLIRLRRDGSVLKLELLNLGWIRDYLESHPASIAHVRVADPENPQDEDKVEMVLTAGTDLLQKFVLEHQRESGFFGDPAELRKAAP